MPIALRIPEATTQLLQLREVALLARDAKNHGDEFSYRLHCELILTALLGPAAREAACADGGPGNDLALQLVKSEQDEACPECGWRDMHAFTCDRRPCTNCDEAPCRCGPDAMDAEVMF